MYLNKQYFKGYSQGGWYEPFSKANIELTYRYNPKMLTKYRAQYIRRAIKTGFVPNKSGPTNAMCMMLFWDQKARYIARSSPWSTHIHVYENELAKNLVQQLVTVDAKLRLMKAAYEDAPRTERRYWGPQEYSMHINGVSQRLTHFLPEDFRTERDSTKDSDEVPAGLDQLNFVVHHADGNGGKAVRHMLREMLESPWYTDQHQDAAYARMFQPFDIDVRVELRRDGYYGTSDRTTINT